MTEQVLKVKIRKEITPWDLSSMGITSESVRAQLKYGAVFTVEKRRNDKKTGKRMYYLQNPNSHSLFWIWEEYVEEI